jgi:hypothetical protein
MITPLAGLPYTDWQYVPVAVREQYFPPITLLPVCSSPRGTIIYTDYLAGGTKQSAWYLQYSISRLSRCQCSAAYANTDWRYAAVRVQHSTLWLPRWRCWAAYANTDWRYVAVRVQYSTLITGTSLAVLSCLSQLHMLRLSLVSPSM